MVEGPGCTLKGEKLKPRIKGQSVKKIGGNAYDRTIKKPRKKKQDKSEENEEIMQPTSPYDIFLQKVCIDIKTLGKEFFMFFEGMESCIRVHFLMAGGFRVNGQQLDNDGGGEAKTPSLRLDMSKDTVIFNKSGIEIRSVGETLSRISEMRTLDIVVDVFSHKRAVETIKMHPGRMICDVLMDQTILPGVGNIIKNEALFDSGIKPDTKVEELSQDHITHLVKMTRDFTMIFYKCRKEGKPLQPYMKVYRKWKCTQCGGKVVNTKMGEVNPRLTCFCAVCQVNDLTKVKKVPLPSKNSLLGWVSNSVSKDIEEWTCPSCTLLNSNSRSNCKVCLTPKVQLSSPTGSKTQSNSRNTTKLQDNVLSSPVLGMTASTNKGTSAKKRKIKEESTPDSQQKKAKSQFSNSPLPNMDMTETGSQSTCGSAKELSASTAKIFPPPCPGHKRRSKMAQVRKEGENCHRMFYSCSLPKGKQCQFFQWADENFPKCEGHDKRCVLRTVLKQGPNNGKKFYACPLKKNKQCGYFQWAPQYDIV